MALAISAGPGDVPRLAPPEKLPKTAANPVDGAEMVWVPAGAFRSGEPEESQRLPDLSQCYRAELPPLSQRKVYLKGFWIYRHKVTNGMWRAFMQATGYPFQPITWTWEFPGPFFSAVFPHEAVEPMAERREQIRHPPVFARWEDAAAYRESAKRKLPAELQWEKAARGTDGRRFPWGNNPIPDLLSKRRLDPVGTHAGGVSPYGAEHIPECARRCGVGQQLIGFQCVRDEL